MEDVWEVMVVARTLLIGLLMGKIAAATSMVDGLVSPAATCALDSALSFGLTAAAVMWMEDDWEAVAAQPLCIRLSMGNTSTTTSMVAGGWWGIASGNVRNCHCIAIRPNSSVHIMDGGCLGLVGGNVRTWYCTGIRPNSSGRNVDRECLVGGGDTTTLLWTVDGQDNHCNINDGWC
jgi:hypothetical protein